MMPIISTPAERRSGTSLTPASPVFSQHRLGRRGDGTNRDRRIQDDPRLGVWGPHRLHVLRSDLRPRIGIQVDAASGDKHAGDSTIGTFNPLFPNGYYFTLAGYTGYTNLIHIKPSVVVKPATGYR